MVLWLLIGCIKCHELATIDFMPDSLQCPLCGEIGIYSADFEEVAMAQESGPEKIIVDQESLDFFAGHVTAELGTIKAQGEAHGLTLSSLTASLGTLCGQVKGINERCAGRLESFDARFEEIHQGTIRREEHAFSRRGLWIKIAATAIIAIIAAFAGLGIGGVFI